MFQTTFQRLQRNQQTSACRVTSLHGLPEELLVELFEAVLSKGKLQPRVLSLFEARPRSRYPSPCLSRTQCCLL